MRDNAERYEISFVMPKKQSEEKPRFELRTREGTIEEAIVRMKTMTRRMQAHAKQYFANPEFWLPEKDMFGNREFGYERCGLLVIEDGVAVFSVDLSEQSCLAASFTLAVLTTVLYIEIEGVPASNQEQQVDIEMAIDPDRSAGYGHAVGGYLSPAVRKWFQRHCGKKERVQAPEVAIQAMKMVWTTLSGKRLSGHEEKDFSGELRSDGRFILRCPGNACDLAIYPDLCHGEIDDIPTRFSCHNLDTATQQLTLLAGLAKLCELARKDKLSRADQK